MRQCPYCEGSALIGDGSPLVIQAACGLKGFGQQEGTFHFQLWRCNRCGFSAMFDAAFYPEKREQEISFQPPPFEDFE